MMGLPELPLGKLGGRIVELLAGPKNYGYHTHKEECKVRGFTMDAQRREQLKFYVLQDNILVKPQRP